MISVGRLHMLALAATALIAGLSVVSGSRLTAIAGGALMAAVVLGARSLHDIVRSKTRTRAVHAVTLGVLGFAVATFQSSKIDAVLLVVMLGIFNRYLLRAGHRDDFLVIGACTVLFAAATTITPGVLFLFLLLGFVPAILWALWASMILGAGEADAREDVDPRRRMAAVMGMAARAAPRQLAFIAYTGLGLLAAGYASVSVLPRYYFTNIFGVGSFMALPGASSSMELRTSGAETIDDSTVIMRVEPVPGKPPGKLAGLYARLYVLDEFDGKTFRSTSDAALFPLRLPADRLPEDRSESEFEPDDDENTVRVTLTRVVRDTQQHPLATLGREAPSEVVRRHARQTMSGTWISGNFHGSALTYKVRLGHGFEPQNLPRHLIDRRAAVLTHVPDSIDPRVLELGQQLAAGKETTAEKVNAALEYLSRGFTYSLEPLEGRSEDPLVRFLFEAKRGHCELYAGALAALLRIGGVRARVVTGYYNGKWNDLGGYLAFTQEDAHAWVEVYDEQVSRWRWVDATPEDLRAVRKQPALAFLRDWYDAAEAFWFDNVIDFDEAKRKALLERMGKRWETVVGVAVGVFDESKSASATRRVPVAAMAIAVAVGGLAVAVGLRKRRRRSPEAIGWRLRKILGARAEENATLGALVARVPVVLRAEAGTCVRLYEAMRFGAPEDAPSLEVVLEAMRALEAGLRRGPRD